MECLPVALIDHPLALTTDHGLVPGVDAVTNEHIATPY